MTRVLFLCGKARMRSPTAAHVAQRWLQLQADYAGLSADADETVTPEHLDWAEIIFVMEKRHKKRLTTKLGALSPGKHLISLDIPDIYAALDNTLIDILTSKLTHYFGPPPKTNCQRTKP